MKPRGPSARRYFLLHGFEQVNLVVRLAVHVFHLVVRWIVHAAGRSNLLGGQDCTGLRSHAQRSLQNRVKQMYRHDSDPNCPSVLCVVAQHFIWGLNNSTKSAGDTLSSRRTAEQLRRNPPPQPSPSNKPNYTLRFTLAPNYTLELAALM
jgi:hypothetical protein